MNTARRGYTLFDMLIVLAIIAAVMALVLPRFRDTTYVRLLAAAQIATSDIEFAQSLCVAHPQDPVVVVFSAAPTPRYWLALTSDPATPIDLENGAGPYRIIFGEGRARHIGGVSVSCTPAGSFSFDGMGAVGGFVSPVVTLSDGSREIRLEISATTGSITQVGD